MPKLGEIMSGGGPLMVVIAILAGIIPAALWLFFWLREDSEDKEPFGLLVMTFLAGMLSVIIVIPFQKIVAGLFTDTITQTVLWSACEEIIKYLAFLVIVSRTPYLDEPMEYPIYLMTAGLGFAALENGLFLMHPLAASDTVVSLLTGNLRFLGATLLHSVCSGIVGIGLGIAYFKSRELKNTYLVIAMFVAIALHAVFNFFIIEKNGENFFQIFGFLWVSTIIIMLLFEKLRRMGKYVRPTAVDPNGIPHYQYVKRP